MKIRLACWNIASAAGPDYRCRHLDRMIAVLAQERCDLILLQEVDRHLPRSGNRDIAALMAEELGMQAWFAPALQVADGAFKPCFDPFYEGPAYGNAILSRMQFLGCENLSLGPVSPAECEHRNAACAVVALDDKQPLFVFSTHLAQSYGEASAIRRSQVDALAARLNRDRTMPLVGGGDFNIAGDHSDLEKLRQCATLHTSDLGPTCSLARGEAFAYPIDHVFSRHAHVSDVQKKSFPELSDHCLVLATLSA